MQESFLNIITLFVTLCVYMWIKPYVDIWVHKMISGMRLARRIKKVGIQASEVENDLEGGEDENIGLSNYVNTHSKMFLPYNHKCRKPYFSLL